MTAPSNLKEAIVEYCSEIGRDSLLVQGAGGNVSWKEGGTLWVKASGTWLAEASEKNIFVPVNLHHLRKEIDAGNFEVTPKLIGESILRPSIETLLHALMPHRVVVHLHAIEVLSFMVRDSCFSELKSTLRDSIRWTIVDYHKPGAGLAAAVNTALSEGEGTDVVFLKNHGVVIGAGTIKGVASILDKLLTDLKFTPINKYTEVSKDIQQVVEEYTLFQDREVQQLAVNSAFFKFLENRWVLYPDHVVFLGAKARIYKSFDAFKEEVGAGNEKSDLVFVLGVGVFVTPDFNSAKAAQLRCYYDVLIRQSRDFKMKPLNTAQIEGLLNWDAERYRKKISK